MRRSEPRAMLKERPHANRRHIANFEQNGRHQQYQPGHTGAQKYISGRTSPLPSPTFCAALRLVNERSRRSVSRRPVFGRQQTLWHLDCRLQGRRLILTFSGLKEFAQVLASTASFNRDLQRNGVLSVANDLVREGVLQHRSGVVQRMHMLLTQHFEEFPVWQHMSGSRLV